MNTATVPTARTWADRLAAVLAHAEHLDLPEPTDWFWNNSTDQLRIRVLSLYALLQWGVALECVVEHTPAGSIVVGDLLEVPVLVWYEPEAVTS